MSKAQVSAIMWLLALIAIGIVGFTIISSPDKSAICKQHNQSQESNENNIIVCSQLLNGSKVYSTYESKNGTLLIPAPVITQVLPAPIIYNTTSTKVVNNITVINESKVTAVRTFCFSGDDMNVDWNNDTYQYLYMGDWISENGVILKIAGGSEAAQRVTLDINGVHYSVRRGDVLVAGNTKIGIVDATVESLPPTAWIGYKIHTE